MANNEQQVSVLLPAELLRRLKLESARRAIPMKALVAAGLNKVLPDRIDVSVSGEKRAAA
jgi:hypothetical protein